MSLITISSSIHKETSDIGEWKVIHLDNDEHAKELTNRANELDAAMVVDVPNTSNSNNQYQSQRVIVHGATTLTAAIATVLSHKFNNETGLEVINGGINSSRRLCDLISPIEAFDTSPEHEFRWSDLHYRLSLQGTQEKFKRQQQRRKALFKHHEQKHVKAARSHAKQKHKGMNRRG